MTNRTSAGFLLLVLAVGAGGLRGGQFVIADGAIAPGSSSTASCANTARVRPGS